MQGDKLIKVLERQTESVSVCERDRGCMLTLVPKR